jgi:hypothetical protein
MKEKYYPLALKVHILYLLSVQKKHLPDFFLKMTKATRSDPAKRGTQAAFSLTPERGA